jgi:hypothetical protein
MLRRVMMNKSYRIENWGITTDADPYKAPEQRKSRLCGDVYGHPNFGEGHNITTSSIVRVEAVDPTTKLVYTSSGSCYILGKVAEEYEAIYPDAFNRIHT